jgi:hypothetical protein
LPWWLRGSVSWGAAMQRSCNVLQNAPNPIVLHLGPKPSEPKTK